MKSKNERRNKWIVAIICVILLSLAFATQGQNQFLTQYRYLSKPSVETRLLQNPIVFYGVKSDKFVINMYIDKRMNKTDTVSFCVQFPKNKTPENCRFKVSYTNNTFVELKQIKIGEGYAEYYLTNKDRGLVKNKAIDGFLFVAPNDRYFLKINEDTLRFSSFLKEHG